MIPKRITNKLDGFRGAFLLVLSVPWMAVGASYVLISTPTRSAAFSYLPELLNENELGWVWILAGLFLLFCAWRGQRHPKFTTIGFLVAIAPPALWASLFFIAFCTGILPTAIVSVVMYGTFVALIFFCSGWPNPGHRTRDAPGGL